jgi:hypothetical protein
MNIRTCGAVIIASSVAFSATAQKPDATPDPEWVLELPEEILVDSSDAGNAADFNARVDKLTLAAGPNTSIILSCQVIQKDGQLRDSRLNVGFDLDTEKDAYKRRMSIRRMSASLTLGEVKKTYRFQWNVDTDTIVPFDRSVARKVFNAAIRGEQIKLKISGKVRIDTTLPTLNEAFRTFAKNCPATQPKQ